MLQFTALFAAAALLPAPAAAPAAAAPEAYEVEGLSASWHPERGRQGRYCVRALSGEGAAAIGIGVHQRTCMSERAWKNRRIGFSRRTAAPRVD